MQFIHGCKHIQQALKSTNKTRIGNNIHSCFAKLSFISSMMVDEHITLFPLLSDCRPDNLKIK